MNNMYEIDKNIEKIKHGNYTCFLLPNLYKQISYKLKKDEYKIYSPYPESDKIILYTSILPNIKLYEIKCFNKLKHSDILGSIYALSINNEVFGDIVVDNDSYYLYVMSEISRFIEDNLTMIGNNKVHLVEVPLDTLSNYKKNYEEVEIIVSSLRIDTIISRIIGTNRDKIKDKIKNKEILLNYDILTNNSYNLIENDIFSIRRFGKYKFIGIIKNTKKDNFLIKYQKYI